MVHTCYSALPISRGHFYFNNSRKTAIARPSGRGMAVFRKFEIWSKFCLRSCCSVCNIVLYCTAIYRGSIVLDNALWRVNPRPVHPICSNCPPTACNKNNISDGRPSTTKTNVQTSPKLSSFNSVCGNSYCAPLIESDIYVTQNWSNLHVGTLYHLHMKKITFLHNGPDALLLPTSVYAMNAIPNSIF